MTTLHAVGNWLYWFLGNSGNGSQYGFWSGFGSDIAEVAILGGVIQLYRKHNCHVRGCWRVAHHPVEGTPYVVCRKHHPTVPDRGPTAEELAGAVEAVRGRNL